MIFNAFQIICRKEQKMKIMSIKHRNWVKPQIKWFPALYRDGELVVFADLRITLPSRTIHIIFNKKGRTK